MHPEYIQYAHHFGIEPYNDPDQHRTSDGRVWVFSCAIQQPKSSQPIVTEDIDYELIEPFKLPPSNTNDNG